MCIEIALRAAACLIADGISSLRASDGVSERCEGDATKDVECMAEFSLHASSYASV